MTIHATNLDHGSATAKGGPRVIKARAAADLLSGVQEHPGRRMTEREFVKWVQAGTRAEWVDGEVTIMSPVNVEHDDLQTGLVAILRTFVEARDLGRVCGSELAVRFEKRKSRRLTDLFFVARGREAHFEKACFNAAPDLVMEIVSPDSTARDYHEKLKLYESAGVREYWVIDPLSHSVIAHEAAKGKCRQLAEKLGVLHSKVIAGFMLRPDWLWRQPLPKVIEVLRELGVK